MNPTFKLPKLTLIEWVDSTVPASPFYLDGPRHGGGYKRA